MIPRDVFVQAVKSCVGTPTRNGGRVAGAALDCVGVPLCAAALCGLHLSVPEPYGNPPGSGALFVALRQHCDEVHPANAIDGDLLVSLWHGEPRHLMVRVGADRHGRIVVVHARGASGFVVEQPILRTAVHSCWRLRGVG